MHKTETHRTLTCGERRFRMTIDWTVSLIRPRPVNQTSSSANCYSC